ncbi:MAG: hypothetical protein DRN04_18180, partial [Thermoprotei archaeon]
KKLKSWYDWATAKLRSLGYPIQFSVVLMPEYRIKEAIVVVDKIKKKLEWNGFRKYIDEVDVKIIRFSTKSPEDAKMMLDIFRELLRDTLKYAKEEAMRKLKEGEDYTKVKAYIQKVVSRIRKQDALKLIERDSELKQLYASLNVLMAGT